VNDHLCSVLQYDKNHIVGKKADILFTVAARIFQQTHFFPLLKMHGHAEEIYLDLQKSNGEHLPVLINAQRKIIGETAVNLHAGIVVHNRKKFEEELITARKTAEKALNENTELIQTKQELQKHSEELDRQVFLVKKQNDELRQFNRVVTHDMQEPLRKLSLFSGMLLEDKQWEEKKKLVDKLKNVSRQMRSILSGLQQYVWLNEAPFRTESIDLVKLVKKVQQELEKEFPDIDLVITVEVQDSFNGDTQQMYLMLRELFSNAIRFRKDKTQAFITVSLRHLQLNEFRTIEGRYKYTDHVKLQVSDKGIGFDKTYKTEVFELFKKLHAQSGWGVGLSLCKKIVENHNGLISIDSKINEGTTVTIHLPRQVAENETGGHSTNLVKYYE
jgi:sigma-B regulation protein RsbU (phosphoserine phosphatase)